jgi:putative transcriptional regulator
MASSIETLAPGFLIAAPMLQDPNFERTVVLMCLHNEEGAMGLVINRPAPFSLRDIMTQLGLECTVEAGQSALVGGPVALNNGLLLYETGSEEGKRDDELLVTSELRLSPNRDLLAAIGQGTGPARFHMFLGHAGWGPGQLEGEIAEGAWIPTPLSHPLIFNIPVERRWDEALRQEGLNPAQIGKSDHPQA